MEIVTNMHWSQSDWRNSCRICLKLMQLEKVSLFDEIKFVYASNEFDIDKPHGLRIMEMMLLCCNSISVITDLY